MPSVLVIGGGPAGACFAMRMAQLGMDVVLVERLAFPRRALGESLTPGVPKLVAAAGAGRALAEARFPPARDVRVSWEGDAVTTVKTQSEGLLVDRGAFDTLLIDHAAGEGVRVLQPAHVSELRRAGHGWEATLLHDGGCERINADFLADARGRGSLAGSPRHAMGQRTLAVFGYWGGGHFPQHASVAAGPRGWFWGIPLPDGSYNAQVFLSPRDLHEVSGQTLEERYRALIAGSELAAAVAGAEVEGPVRAVDATPYLVDEPVTDRSIRLGDAALSLDPISSSGVQKALQSALAGAIVANTLLRRPADAAAARTFYQESLIRTAARHAEWAGQHYAAAARTRLDPFWISRAGPAPRQPAETHEPTDPQEVVRLSPDARLVECPCLGTEFVEVKQALVHPVLDGPVAFVAGQPLASLLSLPPHGRLMDIAQGWSAAMPLASALSIAAWLRRRGVLVPVLSHPGAAA